MHGGQGGAAPRGGAGRLARLRRMRPAGDPSRSAQAVRPAGTRPGPRAAQLALIYQTPRIVSRAVLRGGPGLAVFIAKRKYQPLPAVDAYLPDQLRHLALSVTANRAIGKIAASYALGAAGSTAPAGPTACPVTRCAFQMAFPDRPSRSGRPVVQRFPRLREPYRCRNVSRWSFCHRKWREGSGVGVDGDDRQPAAAPGRNHCVLERTWTLGGRLTRNSRRAATQSG